MSNQDFDFSPPPPRRERKEFEPPPWEKDRLGEVPKRPQDPAPFKPESDEAVEEALGPDAQPAGTPKAEPDMSAESAQKKSASADDTHIASMLFELRAEDPPAAREFHKVGLIAGFVLVAVGVLLVIWAIVMITIASRRAGQGSTGTMIGVTVLMLGFGFAGTGSWFVFKSLRQQGVL